MPRRVSSPEFVGRTAEVAALADAVARADAREFAPVFVAGESGVGKSRLIEEAIAQARERAHVLVGDCVALAQGELPYAPLRGALRRLGEELDPDELADVIGPGRAELARLVPDLVDAVAADGDARNGAASGSQVRLFEVVLGLLARLSSNKPVLLVIEDIHWADPSTLDFLAFVLANARRERLALVCTYRSDELHRRHPLRPFLAQHERPPLERITLRPFERLELRQQLSGILGADPDRELVDRLYERTEGNAFFTEELLAASEDATTLPESLREALLLRVEGLSDASRRVLARAAVHGRWVSHRLLAAVCAIPEEELNEAIREAIAHHVLIPSDDGYAFRHALLQETIEADQLPGELAALHLELAETIARDTSLVSRDGRAAAELYSHWLGAHRLPEALTAAMTAAAEAEEVYALADAARHYERALDLWLEGGGEARVGMDRGTVYARAAEALYLSGDHGGAIRMGEAAAEMVDPGADPYRAALVRERLGRYRWFSSGNTDQALTAHREALALLPADAPGPEGARVLAGLAQMLMLRGELDEFEPLSERAVEVARQTGNRAAEAHALNTLAVAYIWRGEGDEAIARMRESLQISEEVGSIDDVMRGYHNLSEVFDQYGQVDEAARLDLEGVERAWQLGLREWTIALRGEATTRLFKLGQLSEIDRLTEDVLELGPSMGAHTMCACRARMAIYRCDVEAAERLVEAFRRTMPSSLNITSWVEPSGSAEVELELLRQAPEEALRLGETALMRAPANEQIAYTARMQSLTARAAADAAERARAVGDQDRAEELAERALARLERFDLLLAPERWRGRPGPELLAWRETCAAEVGRAQGSATASDWQASAELWANRAFPLEEAYTRLRQAECAVVDGDRAQADAAVARGLELARDCGATWLERELESLARRGRLDLSEPQQAGVSVDGAVERLGLTDREREVLELLATGLTNRQIGERLFMAEKTASVHVSRILAKLDVGSRVEAATVAQRLGMIP